jgi:hypothetical protein
MATIFTKQHDTKITFRDVPTIDGVAIPPANLVGCSLSFLLKSDGATPVAIKQAAIILGDGTFSYDPVPADVATAGDFLQEWELVYPGTPPQKILTFPNGSYNTVKILPDLG